MIFIPEVLVLAQKCITEIKDIGVYMDFVP